nr:hypothetical protein [Tanacetum cinerariifolium]
MDESWFKDKVLLVQAQANGQILHEEELAFLADRGIAEAQPTQTVITHNAAYQVNDLDAYDSDRDEINTAKVSLMANTCHYGTYDLVEVHNNNNVNHNLINQAAQAMLLSEQLNIVSQLETKINSDNNIIFYSQYVNESQQAAVQNSNSPTQQDALILSMIEQLKTQVVNYTKINLDNKSVNDSLTAELERYKDQVRILKEGQKVDLKSKYILSDSCTQSLEIDNLKQTLPEHLKEKESLMQTVTLLKNDFQKEESRNIDREIALEKHIKELSDIVFKRNQSTQTNTKNSLEPIPSTRPIQVEVPNELPKVSLVNTSLKKLKHHLTSFDVVVKDRTTATSITKGTYKKKDMVIKKLKERIKSLSGNIKDDKIKKELDEIETINIEFDQECDDLIKQVNLKSAENYDLNASLQEKVLVITTLKDNLRKLKGKAVVDEAVISHPFDPEMLKVDVAPLALKLQNNRTVHSDYLKHTQEETATLMEIDEPENHLIRSIFP